MNVYSIQKLTKFAREAYDYANSTIDLEHAAVATAYMWYNIIDYADNGQTKYVCFVSYDSQCLRFLVSYFREAGFKVTTKQYSNGTHRVEVDWSC